MLTLSRRPGERVLIGLPTGEVIAVTFCEGSRTEKGKIGFEAPQSVRILREECCAKCRNCGGPLIIDRDVQSGEHCACPQKKSA